MRRLLAPAALLCAFASSPAQLAQPSTPPPLTTFFQEFGGDGSVYTLTNVGGREHYFALPFSLDFAGGYQVVVGKRTADMSGAFTEVPAWGAEVYGLKYLGGDGAYVRVGVRGIFDGSDGGTSSFSKQRPRVTGTLTIGYRARF